VTEQPTERLTAAADRQKQATWRRDDEQPRNSLYC